MICQILRVATYKAGAINYIGWEEHRQKYTHKNSDIDESRSHLNLNNGMKNKSLYQAWKSRLEQLEIKLPVKKNQNVMEQMVITASPEFFKDLGWDKNAAKNWTNRDIPTGIKKYFNDSLRFCHRYIGKENIISATIHFDESTPHMHVDFIPIITGKQKRKSVYEKDKDGKCVRDANGNAIRARDSHGKIIYDYVDEPPSINRTEFWFERGGRQSYRKLQDKFYKEVASHYGLERGEIGSSKEHKDQSKHKANILNKEIKAKQAEISTLNTLEKQSVQGLTTALQKNPNILGHINQALKIAIGEEPPHQKISYTREHNR